MDIENINEYSLKNLNKINIILGKNGCGKSILLRRVEEGLSNQGELYGKTKSITPERGGLLTYDSGIEQSLSSNIRWLSDQRRNNLTPNFRQQSVAQYKKLETLVLREFEQDQTKGKFDPYVIKINTLLDNIVIKRHETAFQIFHKESGDSLNPNSISSGESELISLGIECLIFTKELIEGKENILFLDEPDVHLHPDLQARLMHFLKDLIKENNFRILVATHSTAILGAFESYSDIHLAFMTFNQKELQFKLISEVHKKILPVFGAHPLSNIFNGKPIFLIEGEDDERIWQQVVRSTNGKIKIYPCSVEGVSNMNDFEQEAQKIIQTVYDDAQGYSLRDKDDTTDEIADILPIVRMKLSCRNSENLLLTDEVLSALSTTWEEVKAGIENWLNVYPQHSHYSTMNNFKNSGYDRKNHDIKEIRNDLMGIIASEKPWEIAVGQTIASLTWNNNTNYDENEKILSFLGKKLVENIIPKLDS